MNWVVFDVDGVLLDVGESYDIATELTVEYFTGTKVDLGLLGKLRVKSALGDDYNLSQALICGLGTGDVENFVDEFPRGGTMDWVRERYESPVDIEDIKAVFDTYYLGEMCPEPLFPFDGLWKREKVLVDMSLLEEVESRYSVGAVTGRSSLEMDLAEKTLGYRFEHRVTSDDFLKPDPRALASLVRDEPGVFIGDSNTDEVLVKRYNQEYRGRFQFFMVERDVEDVNEAMRGLL